MDTLYILGQEIDSPTRLAYLLDELSSGYGFPHTNPLMFRIQSEHDLIKKERSFDKYCLPDYALIQRNYSFEDMLYANDLLLLLYCVHSLECTKGKKHWCSAKSILGQFSYNRFFADPFLQENRRIYKIYKPLNPSSTTYVTLEQFESPKKSIRDNFNNFLKEDCIKEYICPNAKNTSKPKLDLHYLPEFLLYFQLFDGTSFEGQDTLYIPANELPRTEKRLPPRHPFSLQAYSSVLCQIEKFFFNKTGAFSPKTSEEYYYTVHLYHLDRLFHFAQINLLREYYVLYTGESMLDYLQSVFGLEIKLLKDVIDNFFFSNAHLLTLLDQSPYLDFFLPFDIQFRHLVLEHKYVNQRIPPSIGERDLILENIIEESLEFAHATLQNAQKNKQLLLSYFHSPKESDDIMSKIDYVSLKGHIIEALHANFPRPPFCYTNFYDPYIMNANSFIHEITSHLNSPEEIEKSKDDDYKSFLTDYKKLISWGLNRAPKNSFIHTEYSAPIIGPNVTNPNQLSDVTPKVIAKRKPVPPKVQAPENSSAQAECSAPIIRPNATTTNLSSNITPTVIVKRKPVPPEVTPVSKSKPNQCP